MLVELPSTLAPLGPGLRANSFCSHPSGGGRQPECKKGMGACEGRVSLANGAEDRSAEARQVGQAGEQGHWDEVREKSHRGAEERMLGSSPGASSCRGGDRRRPPEPLFSHL